MSEKRRRPILEALLARTDGLDILAEIAGEKREEKPAPTDTLSGMLQTLPMLVMLPAVMPLLQQMLTQTLSSSTVNVKVETATAIIPIEISAATAIVPIEIKASTVTLNVNITGSSVTLNVGIQAQAVDLKIYTPSGRWVSASDVVSIYIEAYGANVPAATEVTLIDVTGSRGRLKNLGLWITDSGAPFAIEANIKFRIYVDGSLRVEFPIGRLDGFTGFHVWKLTQALSHALSSDLPLPFNTARVATSPDRYLVMPFHDNPRGGVTYYIYDYTNSKIREIGGFLIPDIEFSNSLSIRVYNGNTTYSAIAYAVAMIGEYL